MYDMAVGERISSVFNGAADKDAYNQVALVPKERTIKVPSDAKRQRLENLMRRCEKFAKARLATNGLGKFGKHNSRTSRRLAVVVEIFEILDATDQQRELKTGSKIF